MLVVCLYMFSDERAKPIRHEQERKRELKVSQYKLIGVHDPFNDGDEININKGMLLLQMRTPNPAIRAFDQDIRLHYTVFGPFVASIRLVEEYNSYINASNLPLYVDLSSGLAHLS